MGRRQQKSKLSRKEQLRTLNRNLIRIGLILFAASVVFELFVQPQFSLQRLLFLWAAAVLGLLIGRTLGKMFFLRRK